MISFLSAKTLYLLITFGSFACHAAIVIKDNRFYDESSGKPFIVRGMAYQPRQNGRIYDPISNMRKSAWMRDLQVMEDLGINTVRVYEIEPSLPHDEFMNELQSRSMYLILDLGRREYSLNRDSPEYSLESSTDMLKTLTHSQSINTIPHHLFVLIHNSFSNVLGYFAGNEVVNSFSSSVSAPHMKALIRDLKARSRTLERYIPIGYSDSDDAQIRDATKQYFTCGDEEAAVDFFGLNLYEWCGKSSYKLSGYADRTREMQDLKIPLLISEYGCNTVRPRIFQEIDAIYGKEMLKVWSGGIMYEFTDEDNSYGIVEIDRNGVVPIQPEFDAFQKKMVIAASTLANISSSDFPRASFKKLDCPASFGPGWRGTTELPKSLVDDTSCADMVSSLECVTSWKASSEDVGKLLSTTCGLIDNILGKPEGCLAISTKSNTTSSSKDFSHCSAKDRLSWAYNEYYRLTCRASTSCEFNGTAALQSGIETGNDGSYGECRVPSEAAPGLPFPNTGEDSNNGMFKGVSLRLTILSSFLIIFFSF
ncbi:Glucanosyltransferase-domain-containing protein [Chytridium lagenaria]|nr:Glucanosyltransferase-domain-containing protein [Chytridium lagenaria]